MIRISGDTIVKTSLENFTITDQDTTNCHNVVLGSSTAVGTGPTVVDSAWVWKYRDTLFQNGTRFSITNLAKSGFTTYNILPDGHRVLLDRVLQKMIDDFLLESKETTSATASYLFIEKLEVFPNPTNDSIRIQNVVPPFDLLIADSSGNELIKVKDFNSTFISLFIEGMQYIKIKKDNDLFGTWVLKISIKAA